MKPRADGRGWEVDQLPPGLVAVVDAPVSQVVRWRSQEGSEITVLWSEREGTVAHELRLGDGAVDDLDELLVSIVEQDEAVWEQLIDRLGPR